MIWRVWDAALFLARTAGGETASTSQGRRVQIDHGRAHEIVASCLEAEPAAGVYSTWPSIGLHATGRDLARASGASSSPRSCRRSSRRHRRHLSTRNDASCSGLELDCCSGGRQPTPFAFVLYIPKAGVRFLQETIVRSIRGAPRHHRCRVPRGRPLIVRSPTTFAPPPPGERGTILFRRRGHAAGELLPLFSSGRQSSRSRSAVQCPGPPARLLCCCTTT